MSSRALLCGGGVDDEVPVDGVGDAAFQRSDRLFRGLAVSKLALVVGAAVGVVAELGDGWDALPIRAIVFLPLSSRTPPD